MEEKIGGVFYFDPETLWVDEMSQKTPTQIDGKVFLIIEVEGREIELGGHSVCTSVSFVNETGVEVTIPGEMVYTYKFPFPATTEDDIRAIYVCYVEYLNRWVGTVQMK